MSENKSPAMQKLENIKRNLYGMHSHRELLTVLDLLICIVEDQASKIEKLGGDTEMLGELYEQLDTRIKQTDSNVDFVAGVLDTKEDKV
jgi:hypothetical protein